jgi:hypothetical protein
MTFYKLGNRGLVLFALLLSQAPVDARVTRIVIETREAPAYKGQSFGGAGQYVRLAGHFFGELDPKAPLNAIIGSILSQQYAFTSPVVPSVRKSLSISGQPGLSPPVWPVLREMGVGAEGDHRRYRPVDCTRSKGYPAARRHQVP